MERTCLICGSATTEVMDNSPLGAVMFYEGICKGCAKASVAEVVEGGIRLSEHGTVALYSNDALGSAERAELPATAHVALWELSAR